jgi:hypothetical protein
MDQEFKKILDKIRDASEMAKKVAKIMDSYQEHLDTMVEEGIMTEHDARMDFFTKTHEVMRDIQGEDEDDDAFDESEDRDDDEEKCPVTDFFSNHEEIWKAYEHLVKICDRDRVHCTIDFHIDDAVGSDDRC